MPLLKNEPVENTFLQCGGSLPSLTTSMIGAQTWPLHGLNVRSNYPLLFPSVFTAENDLTIRYEGLMPRPSGSPTAVRSMLWKQEGNEWVLYYHFRTGDVLEFRLPERGKSLSVRHTFHEWKDILLLLLGGGLGASLYLQGVPIFHGTSVVMDGAAVLLVGHSDTGKSTITGLLASQGYPFLCDDLAALRIEDGDLTVQPSHPWLKLHRRSAVLLGLPEKDLRPVFASSPEYPERWLDTNMLSGGFRDTPAPLRGIYIIAGRRDDIHTPRIYELSPGNGCLALTGHLYGRRWLNIPQESALRLCARIAETVPVRRVWLPEGLDNMRVAADAIMADAVTL